MFLVSDTRKERSQAIKKYLDSDPTLAVVLAAIDFEWSCKRCVLALGTTPTAVLKQPGGLLVKHHGPEGYKKLWKAEVKPNTGHNLTEVIPNWEYLTTHAFPLRHRLVHGSQGSVGSDYANKLVSAFLTSSESLAYYAEEKLAPIFGRVIRRTKPWTPRRGLRSSG